MSGKSVWTLLKDTYSEWSSDNGQRLAAALAYYSIFSIAPLLIIIIAAVGFILGKDAAQGQIVNQLRDTMGSSNAQMIQSMIQNASKPSSGIIATVLGILSLLLGATGVFGELKAGLNIVWDAPPKKTSGILGVVVDRLLGFIMVLFIGFLLVLSLAVSSAISAIGNFVGGTVHVPVYLYQAADFVVSFLVITLLFAAIYKLLPDRDVAWKDVWIGAAVTSLLFTIGKFLLGLYLSHASVGSTYGAAGSLVILLIWVYYSAQIFYFGAEFTQVYASKHGRLGRTTTEPSPARASNEVSDRERRAS